MYYILIKNFVKRVNKLKISTSVILNAKIRIKLKTYKNQ